MRLRVGILTSSDRCAVGEMEDTSGRAIAEACEQRGWDVATYRVCADDAEALADALRSMADSDRLDVVLTTGGTGLGPRDVMPETTLSVADRIVPGIAEAIRLESLRITPRAMLSRAIAAQRGNTLIVNLPGSEKAVRESLAVFIDQLEHAVEMMAGGRHD